MQGHHNTWEWKNAHIRYEFNWVYFVQDNSLQNNDITGKIGWHAKLVVWWQLQLCKVDVKLSDVIILCP